MQFRLPVQNQLRFRRPSLSQIFKAYGIRKSKYLTSKIGKALKPFDWVGLR